MREKQFVIERDDRFARSGIALPTGAAEELPVDAGRVVVLRQDHVQAAGLPHCRAEHDVGAAPGHVGGHGDPPRLPGLRDDLGFARVLARIEHRVRQPGRRSR
jgi:hypothetical protein